MFAAREARISALVSPAKLGQSWSLCAIGSKQSIFNRVSCLASFTQQADTERVNMTHESSVERPMSCIKLSANYPKDWPSDRAFFISRLAASIAQICCLVTSLRCISVIFV